MVALSSPRTLPAPPPLLLPPRVTGAARLPATASVAAAAAADLSPRGGDGVVKSVRSTTSLSEAVFRRFETRTPASLSPMGGESLQREEEGEVGAVSGVGGVGRVSATYAHVPGKKVRRVRVFETPRRGRRSNLSSTIQ